MADYRQLAGALTNSDTIQATPRNPVLGGVADLLGMAYKLPEMPRIGVPGIDFLAANRKKVLDLLQMGDVQKTADALSYGNAIGTGKGMTYRPKDETIGAALAIAPFAGKAIRATEGLPVGASTKLIEKNIFDDATKYHQKVPEITSINIGNLKRMNAGEVADVSDEVAANMDFSKPIQVSVFSDGELRIVDGHHRVAAAKKLGMTTLPVDLQAINAKGSTLNQLALDSNYSQITKKP